MSHWRALQRGWSWASVGAVATLILAACGGTGAAPTPTATKAPAPAATATPIPVAQPTATPTARAAAPGATATPTAMPVPPTPIAGAKRGGTLNVARALDPSTLDPQTGVSGDDHQYWYAFFNNLIAYDNKVVLQPSMSLAEKWEIVDPTTIRMDLRKGVTFQDGTPFNADAAIWNLNRVLDPATKSTERGAMSVIQKIDKLDDYSIRLNLKTPSGSLLTSMGDRGGAMVSPTAVQAMGDKFGQKPVGTGPWQVTNWTPAQVVNGERFKNYWKKDLPYFDKLNIRIIPDDTVSFASLQTGEVDLAILAAVNVARARADKNMKIVEKVASTTSIFVNQTKPPMDNLKVRQAIVAALDPDAINKIVYLGLSIPSTGGYWPPDVWAYNKLFDKWPTDVAKAKQFLAEAGFPQGVSLKLQAYSAPAVVQTAEVIKQQLSQAGIKIDIVVRDVAAATNSFFTQPKGPEGELHMYTAGFSLRADPNGNAGIHMHRSGFYTRWLPDPEEDALVEKAASLYDQADRKKLYAQIQEINWAKVNDIWILYGTARAGLRADIQAEDTVFGGEGKFRYEWLWRK